MKRTFFWRKGLWVLLLLPFMAFASFDWLTVTIDDKVSVEFPTQPEKQDMQGNDVWLANHGTNARCMTMVLDFEKFGMDAEMVKAEMGKPESFEGFKTGILSQMEGASIVAEKSTTTNGYITYEFTVDMGKKDTAAGPGMMYNRNIFVGSKMYNLSFFETKGKPMETDRNRFLNSIKIK
jgi:hypothetical protein